MAYLGNVGHQVKAAKKYIWAAASTPANGTIEWRQQRFDRKRWGMGVHTTSQVIPNNVHVQITNAFLGDHIALF